MSNAIRNDARIPPLSLIGKRFSELNDGQRIHLLVASKSLHEHHEKNPDAPIEPEPGISDARAHAILYNHMSNKERQELLNSDPKLFAQMRAEWQASELG
jgi:hypothetical protein